MMTNPPITLGQLIMALEKLKPTQYLQFDFCEFRPDGYFSSYRGFYEDLAMEYTNRGTCQIEDFLPLLKKEIGAVHIGWKGGEYTMGEDTLVWVATEGDVTRTAVVGVMDFGYLAVIQTAYTQLDKGWP